MTGPPGWRKSSFCASGECLEARPVDAGGELEMLLRNSKHGAAARCSADEWRAFVAGVKNGEFGLPG